MTEPMSAERLAEIRGRLVRTGASSGYHSSVCMCADDPHINALHDLAYEDVPELLAEIERLRAHLYVKPRAVMAS